MASQRSLDLGAPEGTISSRLATAHRTLAKRLKLRGFTFAGGLSVLTILSSHRSAMSEAQAMSLVRSAITSPKLVVSQLATEVTKMLLLEKLRAAGMLALAMAFVIVMAIGLAPQNQVSAGDPKAKALPAAK